MLRYPEFVSSKKAKEMNLPSSAPPAASDTSER
jgi:hypothetical protein